jgi:hypothetical protein
MDTRTGDMVPAESVGLMERKDQKFYKLIPDILLPELAGMNREQRRQWYRRNKKRIKALATPLKEAS